MRSFARRVPAVPVALAALVGAAAPSAAQLVPASGASAALGDHDVATVSGFGAVALNPARLGMASPARTGAGLSVRTGAGLEPVTLGDLGAWDGRPVPATVREAWLQQISAEGAERGTVSARTTPLAVSRGRWGVQLSTVAWGRVDLNEDAAELILFGNAGRTGDPRPLELEGSRLDAAVVSTLGVAAATPPREVRGGMLALGATAKLILGHALVMGRDAGSTLSGEPLDVRFRFPLLSTAEGGLDRGRGLGLDMGAAWEGGRLSLALVVGDLLNTFRWDESALVFRPGTALVDQEGSSGDFEDRPATEAPDVLRDAVRKAGFATTVTVGAGWLARPDLSLVASTRIGPGGNAGIPSSVDASLGVGAELRRWDRVPLRGHLTVLEGTGVQAGAGAGIRLGAVWLTGAGWARSGESEDAWMVAFGVSWRGS